MASHEYNTPALVLGGPSHTTLGVIRALALSDIPQFTVGAGSSYVSYSRWHHRLPPPHRVNPTPGTLAPFLEGLPFERMVLIPCSDEWVAAVAHLDADLAARFPASIAPPGSIDICLDKGRFAATIESLGLPHPRTISLVASDDVAGLARTLTDPFIKPRNSLAFRTRYGIKAFYFGAFADPVARIREAQQAGLDVMLQEFIPGPATSHYMIDGVVDRSGSICACFARRRLRTHPEPFGDSSCIVSIHPADADEPIAALTRLLTFLRYRGVFSSEFKYDERDGVFKIIELNPRVWGGVSLPVNCGVNVVEMAYRDALGLRVEPVLDYPVDRRWVYGSRDALASWRLFRAGRLTASDWVRTWTGAMQAISRLDDPVPGLMDFVQLVGLVVRGPKASESPEPASRSQS